MAQYSILTGSPFDINLMDDIADQGWTVSANIGYHGACNSGYMDMLFDLSIASSWTFEYDILSVETGHINLVVNNVVGPDRTVAGNYKETRTVTGSNILLRFFSNGVNSIKLLQVYPATADGSTQPITLRFDEKYNMWAGTYAFYPELMMKFDNGFFIFESGRMWENHTNPIRNNFCGVQSKSIITFYINTESGSLKDFFTMRVNSNAIWSAPEIKIYPVKGKGAGMTSRLKKNRFQNYQGKFFADFLRNMSDPRYVDSLVALFKGSELQGDVMEITIENNDTFEVRLSSVEVEMELQEYTL